MFLLIIATVLIGIIMLLVLGMDISAFYFYPTKVEATEGKTPFDHPNEISMVKPNGTKLYALYRNTNSNKIILYLHGNAGNIYMEEHVLHTIGINHNLLLLDYSGFGKSSGTSNASTIQDDVVFVYKELLKNGYLEENIILYGRSIGCCLASYLCTIFSPSKLILQSGPSSINDVVNHMCKGAGTALGYVYDHLNAYKYLCRKQNKEMKILLIHSRTDEVVPFSCAEKMFPHATDFLEITGSHNHPNLDYEYINQFIDR